MTAMLSYERNMRCDKCKYCKDVYTSPPQVKVRGCYHEPYHGKQVTEIDICPWYKTDTGSMLMFLNKMEKRGKVNDTD